MSTTFSLACVPYYDQVNQCYKNVVTVDRQPTGVLVSVTKQLSFPPLSPFDVPSNCYRRNQCKYVVLDPSDKSYLLDPRDIAALYSYLLSNGCTVNTDITNMTLKSGIMKPISLVAFVTVP